MLSSQLLNRLKKELAMLEHEPPPGIICYPVEDDCTHLEAHIKGPVDSPFEIGTFKLDIQIPQRYPFDPPQMRFITPIYHPNIDEAGRICADILKMPPAGNWVPALNLSTVLLALSGLMSEPNPDDPLEMEIAAEYKENLSLFKQKAQQMTLKHALNGLNTTEPTSSCQTPLLGAADPISPVTTQTTSTSSIDQDGTLESSTLPAIRSKKLSKMSLSKRKPEKDNIPSSQKEQTEMKDKMMNIISQTSTSVTSKYFAITSTKAIPSSNNIETVDNPLNIGGETQQPLTTNKIISGNSEPEDRSPSFEPPLHTFSNSLSKTCSHGYDAVAKQIEQKNESADVASTLSSNHNNTTEHSANNHYSVDGVHTTPPSTNSICTTSRNPSASIAYSTIRDDSKLVNISNRFESNAIILDPPVSRKRALLSLGKSKKLKM